MDEPEATDTVRPEAIRASAAPLPGRAVITQRWRDAVFLHWRVDPARVAPHLPPGTRPDITDDGASHVGLIAFRLEHSAFPPLPRVPWLGDFLELNVRLYSVDERGRRGVVFLTLEAEHLLPVLAARVGLGLPYRWARMRSARRGGPDGSDELAFTSARLPGGPRSRMRVRLTPDPVVGDPLADFLTARWGMHVGRGGRTTYWRNEHEAWPLRRAELVALDDGLLAHHGFGGLAAEPPDSVLFSDGVRTRFAAPADGPGIPGR